MNRQIIIRTVVAFLIFLSVSSQPIAAQNQIFPTGKLGYANVASIAWNSSGDLLAIADGLTIDLIDTTSYQRVALLTGYTREVLSDKTAAQLSEPLQPRDMDTLSTCIRFKGVN
jgi:hypothetical protein